MRETARRRDGGTAREVVRWTLLLGVLAPWRLAAQEAPPPPERYRQTTAFPLAIGVELSSASYGDRAQKEFTSGGPATYNLSGGLALGVRLQAPLMRRIGVIGGASITRRGRRGEREGDPFSSNLDKVTFNRIAAGLGFRFRPSAPVFVAAVFVYDRVSPGPVEFQDATVSETGGGLGLGIDFGRTATLPLFGRFEVWNYWVKPSATDLDIGYEAKGLTRDLVLALSLNYRIPSGAFRRRG